ncbi:trypsin-like peptidase domain-containing protein [Stappia sp. BW2]|uniref:S1 family peptidase n=1 Tax=Stappia sp. BW2 TaxID=2592622 RepID=UPI0011DEC835|nr:serine protease [Stappia sp. BW2]TYC67331.1 trypsin-like peptidase domain-containing protein [Stappia sp. BW2]
MNIQRLLGQVYTQLPPVVSSFEMDRVVQLRYANARGTMFWVDNGLVGRWATAKHAVENMQNGDQIAFLGKNGEELREVSHVWFSTEYDLALFSIDGLDLGLGETLIARGVISAPIIFLGFPHGLHNRALREHPNPLVKGGLLAGFVEDSNGVKILALDGMNNPGFSGGPVFANFGRYSQPTSVEGNRKTFRSPDELRPGIIGMINSYRYELEQHGAVYSRSSGVEQPTNYFVKMNSGIAHGTPIDAIIKQLDRL